MYNRPRIISKPISNNRLNFDERTNRSIIVPSLIEGTLDDVEIEEEIAIEIAIDGKIVAGKGLKHFVFLKNSRVPTWIMDNHNHAFAFWHEALAKGFIRTGSLLVHIDQHTDLATPSQVQSSKFKVQNEGLLINSETGIERINNPQLGTLNFELGTLDEIEDYTNSILTIADFIVPAMATGLISEALMVTGEDVNGAGTFSWGNNSLVKKSSVFPLSSSLFHSIIVDLDLDYFSQGFDEKKTYETVKYWIEKADIITIATSPLFINQKKALEYLRKLF